MRRPCGGESPPYQNGAVAGKHRSPPGDGFAKYIRRVTYPSVHVVHSFMCLPNSCCSLHNIAVL
eukprot:6203175-Pleurochrysis_carterae.AAC.1